MRKLFFLMCGFMITPMVLFSQEVPDYLKIEWGPEEETSRKESFSDIVGYDETGIYALKQQMGGGLFFRTTNLTLEHYDNDIKKTRTTLIDLNLGNNKITYEGIYQFGNRLYLFSSQNDQSQKKNKLYVQLIDKKTLKPSKKKAELADIGYKSRNNDGKFDIRLSRDSSHMMVWYDLPYRSGNPEIFGLQVYDQRFQLLWKKDIELPYTDQLFQMVQYKVDSHGNAYLLGKVYTERLKERRGGKPNYKYHILTYRDQGRDLKEYIFELDEQFITDMQFEIDDAGNIVTSGFYSDRGSTSIKGSFFSVMDVETGIYFKQDLKDFSRDEIAEFLNERKADKGKELYEYDLNSLILRDDGGAYLIAEQYYVKITTVTDPSGFPQTNYRYYYNDIGIVNIDPSGKIAWMKRIPKKQISTNDEGFFSSFAFSRHQDNLFLIFNDNPKNLQNTDARKIHNFQRGKNSTVVIVKIDDQGNVTKDRLFDVREASILTRPKVSEQVSESEMIIYGQWRKSNRLAKLIFK